jgi:hypothetical protein
MEIQIRFGAAVVLAASAAAAQAGGLSVPSGEDLWPRLQARLGVSTEEVVSATDRYGLTAGGGSVRLQSATLLGDFYFERARSPAEPLGGFRATSGLLFGSQGLAGGGTSAGPRAIGHSVMLGMQSLPASVASSGAGNDLGTVLPYFGLGYSSLDPRGGWGFSADLGLLAQNPGSVRLGRAFGSPQGMEDTLRELRLSPVLQLGVNYAF